MTVTKNSLPSLPVLLRSQSPNPLLLLPPRRNRLKSRRHRSLRSDSSKIDSLLIPCQF